MTATECNCRNQSSLCSYCASAALQYMTAEAMKADILALIEDGTVPATVSSYSELHNYVDANMLGFEVYGSFPAADETDDAAEARMERETPIFNSASSEVDRWLKVRAMLGPETAPELSPCCGAHVTYSGDGALYCKKCFGPVQQ